MGRDRKRRGRRRETDRGASLERRRSRDAAPLAAQTPRLGELIRYAIVCTVLLSVATPVGIAVAFFWGVSLLRRFQATRAADAALPPAGEWLPAREDAPRLAPVQLAELLERETTSRAERFARRGVEVLREIDGDGALSGDAGQLGLAIGDLLDAALAQLDAGEKPRLALELGENLAGSEVWLRIRGAADGPAPGRAGEPAPLRLRGLSAADRVARAHGGRLEALSAGAGGIELLLTLPKDAANRP
jgi:hypothetical protein